MVDDYLQLIESESGKYFVSELVANFKDCLPDILKIKAQFCD